MIILIDVFEKIYKEATIHVHQNLKFTVTFMIYNEVKDWSLKLKNLIPRLIKTYGFFFNKISISATISLNIL